MHTPPKVLITGANGFLGSRLAHRLNEAGYTNSRYFIRSHNNKDPLVRVEKRFRQAVHEYFEGNLVQEKDAAEAVKDIDIVIHCAAAKGGPIASMYLNTVVATRNLLMAASHSPTLKRFVHVSSFAVYGTAGLKPGTLIDERSPLEQDLEKRQDGYAFIKIKQEQLLRQFERQFNLPAVIVRPGVVYGPGGDEISRRVGMQLFGFYINVGRDNLLPLSYVDNCADAIIKAATVPDIEGETINILDSDLRTCSQFLKGYKKKVRHLRSINMPYPLFWLFSGLVESYAKYSKGQIPAVLTRYKTASTWKRCLFDNSKLVNMLSWSPGSGTEEGLSRHFRYFKRRY